MQRVVDIDVSSVREIEEPNGSVVFEVQLREQETQALSSGS